MVVMAMSKLHDKRRSDLMEIEWMRVRPRGNLHGQQASQTDAHCIVVMRQEACEAAPAPYFESRSSKVKLWRS
jgi:hypothetical protein